MENGLMTIEKTGERMKVFFMDQESLEHDRLYKRTKHRINMRRKEKSERVRFRKRMGRNANRILLEVILGAAVTLAGTAGMIHLAIWLPVTLICLCAACVRLGVWFGRVEK